MDDVCNFCKEHEAGEEWFGVVPSRTFPLFTTSVDLACRMQGNMFGIFMLTGNEFEKSIFKIEFNFCPMCGRKLPGSRK